MTSATTALSDLHRALNEPREHDGMSTGDWRWTVRQRMTAVCEVLMVESDCSDDAWLSARGGMALRERKALLARIRELGPAVLDQPDMEHVRAQGLRLLTDINHHLQRMRNLAYDEVELELGGSE